jgi:2-polyprenyl-6-methoxyphenol hydroxylase-like FAD-dependent oxidoreductase
MVRETNAEVLIAGAGPVGMTTALLLAEQGVKVALIDAEGGTAAQSYACALHPQSLELLDRFGLSAEILEWGQRIDTVAFYEGPSRQAEIKLADLPAKFPFVVVLPQNALEWLLERTLNRLAGIKVNWRHRLSDLRSSGSGVVANVDQLGGTSLGYIVPHWEVIVQDTTQVAAAFLVGADGHASLVRRCLGIEYERVGQPELFAVFEFETNAELGSEVRVVLDDATTNVLWPLPGGRCRWSFQVAGEDASEEFPEKDRRSVWIDDPEADQRIKRHLQKLVLERASWFTGNVKEISWVGHVQFGRRLAKRFGDGRCWLVGDAAHQTSPVGVQSLNVGLREAGGLAETLQNVLRGGAAGNVFENYDRRWREEWQRLFGLKGAPKASGNADDWVRRHAAGILPCLPASGDDLAQCMKQIQLELP